MKYYHGTNIYFKNFDISKSGTYKDFGIGIYLSESEIFAKRTALWKGGLEAYIYTYQVNLTNIRQSFTVKEFRTASIEWLKYIILNRQNGIRCDYDLVIGPTADAHAQEVVERFITTKKNPSANDYKRLQAELMPKTAVDRQLCSTQICVKTQRLLDVFNSSRIKETKLK